MPADSWRTGQITQMLLCWTHSAISMFDLVRQIVWFIWWNCERDLDITSSI